MGKKVLIMPSPPNSGSLGSTLKFIGLAQNLVEDGWETAFVLGGHVAQLVEAASYRRITASRLSTIQSFRISIITLSLLNGRGWRKRVIFLMH